MGSTCFESRQVNHYLMALVAVLGSRACLLGVLGVSSSQQACDVTRHDGEGPYHIGEERSGVNFGAVPFRSRLIPEDYVGGEPSLVWSGRLVDSQCCPLEGWEIDIWHAGDEATAANGGMVWGGSGGGAYSRESPFWFRGRLLTDADGAFRFDTVVPPSYPGRPIRHFHVRMEHEDTVKVTQIYFTNFRFDTGQRGRSISASQLATIVDGFVNFDLVVDVDESDRCSSNAGESDLTSVSVGSTSISGSTRTSSETSTTTSSSISTRPSTSKGFAVMLDPSISTTVAATLDAGTSTTGNVEVNTSTSRGELSVAVKFGTGFAYYVPLSITLFFIVVIHGHT